ncbi:hypothetical protein BU25DRAFT_191956 [Macroventuria anomochaeta]|uniref:Uncharacterized protein n=1 Tax=Macroventuria anomochaeta TaxID=301207 RepID=A0ACB6SC73_9PLEO|nr:uncharacterized protein BU25DRAFT_191956 [Macroventuria anomochaeta]KAF2631608.1 hypothetical protein BU25DRAFT_191956 [Macroventuria anomochaeta]
MCHQQPSSYNTAGPFISYAQPADTWYCSECNALNMNWYDVCPVCNQGTRQSATYRSNASSYTSHGSAGSPAPGSWACDNCGASNSDNTPDFCPICGASR